ncbi:DUF726-domain-containing protein [Saccharata proteae CBS 121410]|uniref:DUF726-domain-containing protein n=1 Tax=Saccharata proteae CBS 121410 TaxID=1314787 RepID=A0A9P4LXZ8_9PEZI|nr:DUF726-domain-containing protein [Saccharata proteae CBS 121410]
MPEDGVPSEAQNTTSAAGQEAVVATAATRAARPDDKAKTEPELDEFGLPIRRKPRRQDTNEASESKQPGHEEPGESQEDKASAPAQEKEQIQDATVNEPRSQEAPPSSASGPPAKPGTPEQQSGINGNAAAQPQSAAQSQNHTRSTSRNILAENVSEQAQPLGASEWSHQRMALQPPHEPTVDEKKADEDDGEWQEMPAYAPYDMYDDDNRLIAREAPEYDEEIMQYGNLGGAGKGYTRVQIDEDAQSATSMDDNTAYLFKGAGSTNVADEDDDARDPLSQMQATKDLLTEGQRIAYVGIVRLAMIQMCRELERLERTKGAKKQLDLAVEATRMWSQKMMVRLYSHMEIDAAEQIMIEQLAEHGVEPGDLTPALMQNSRVKNPVADSTRASVSSPRPGSVSSPRPGSASSFPPSPNPATSRESMAPPPYEEHQGEDLPEVRTPSQLPNTKNIDIDLRWTVLCDLFLVLIADSVYDARSRQLLERVGSFMHISWLEICRFEKRVTDALEMQEAANKENWNEDEHMASRKKMARNRRLALMGLATVGGSLVIGLSAGLLAPVIGAGIAAGFTTIGVAGTGGFLAGAGGAAIITTGGVLSGGTIAVRAAGRRTGAVKTFEYRPLHNNKRVNLIITVSGWMSGKIDDVRLPYSTVDPIMGDIYSVFWEPEMLQSMGDTINILATEALTQGLQQVLGSTILVALMGALQLPVVLTKLAYLIDNPWTVSQARAELAGLILADSLIDRNLGVRPVTLVGFSLGARVIFYCLQELARKGAFGLVQNVYLFGSPMVVKKDEYLRAKSVVPGRFVNGYATNDWILGYLFRATSGGIMRVAGLAPINIPGIENFDVTELVAGHMAYRAAMPRLLREVGWVVESDEFTEIEDPDPENHVERQRELINEIEEARKAMENKPQKKKWGLFRKKMAEKKEWETYDEKIKIGGAGHGEQGAEGTTAEGKAGENVLFDIDAIRKEAAELAAQGIEVRQLESTLPPMKLEPPPPLRSTKSYNDVAPSSGKATAATAATGGPHEEYDEFYSGNGEGSISMTFDTSYTSPPVSTTNLHERSPAWSSPERPPLRSSATMPLSMAVGGAGVEELAGERKAWAEEVGEDDEWGKEKEMSMTFE